MTNLEKKLKSYSLLASGVIACGVVQAQIQYTDIDPDLSINRNESLLINMNNAGKAEFLINNEFSSYSSSGIKYIYNILGVQPKDTNEFLGVSSAIQTSSSSTYLFVPQVMEQDDVIDSNESYWTDDYYGVLYANINYGSLNIKAGKWLGEEDKYVGVRFTFNGETDWHYGWIRLSVPNDSTIIVKDFAYESHLGKAIKAGATYSSIEETQKQFNIYSTAKNLIIENNEEGDAQLFVYNITGQAVLFNNLKSGHNSFEVTHLPQGYYIVKLQSAEAVYTEKILLK